MQPFRAAVEAHDMDAVAALLAPGVTFRSPVAFQPYEGRELVAAILRGVLRVFEGFRYERELEGDGGRDAALVFRATVGGREVHGCDFLRLDEDGLIEELTVMVRPLSAAQAVSAAMGEEFAVIQRELAG